MTRRLKKSTVELQVDSSGEFQFKSEIDRILDRPGTYIGSVITEITDLMLYVPSTNSMQLLKGKQFNAGLLKLVDEVITNSTDEYKRHGGITRVDVTVNTDGHVTVLDDGGIPVKVHGESGLLNPEFIFGTIGTSSNYDDNVSREWAGLNGLGGKIANIYSTRFKVETCDRKNKVTVDWYDNMKHINKDLKAYRYGFDVVPSADHYTLVDYNIQLSRFELETIPLSMLRVFQKRCITAAASNPGLTINFKSDAFEGKLDSTWYFKSFDEFVRLHVTPDLMEGAITCSQAKFKVVLIPGDTNTVGIVNGSDCHSGSHVNKIESQVTNAVLDYCKKNDMPLITEKDITSRFGLYIDARVPKPSYSSQSKERLTMKLGDLLNLNDNFLTSVTSSKLVALLKIFYEVKYAEEKKKEINKLNKLLKETVTRKLIPPQVVDRDRNELWLFEGDSASNGFRMKRNLFQGAYLLRGKIPNTFNLSRSQVTENVELREILAYLNLRFNDPVHNLKNIKVKRIILGTDMDHDGNHICSLLVAFMGVHFPEVLAAGMVYRALSPIIICSRKGQPKMYFYDLKSFEQARVPASWEITYTKGLGGLENDDYRQMLRNQKLIRFIMNDEKDVESIKVWFDKDTTSRKELIMLDGNKDV
jgi:DNA topoisomerase-2